MKVNDVYEFRYHPDMRDSNRDTYWCFDGLLIALQNSYGLYLVDTYYMYFNGAQITHVGDGMDFLASEVEKKGTLKFLCNLDDVVEIPKFQTDYYADEDIFDLSHQHKCRELLVRKKDAKRSKEKIKTAIEREIERVEKNIKSEIFNIGVLRDKLKELETADVEEFYFPK